MKKFWEWMYEKEYAEKGELDSDSTPYVAECVYKPYHDAEEIKFTKQMLIGYMMEYIHENDILKDGKEGIIFNTDETYKDLKKVIGGC